MIMEIFFPPHKTTRMDLNKVMIIGRLTKNPEARTTPQGTNVASFSVATNFVWTDAQGQKQEKVEFHNVVAWRRLAEICNQYLTKGKKIYIEGRLQTRDWTDQSGVKKYRTEIVAENMIMLDRVNPSSQASNNEPQPQQVNEEPAPESAVKEEEIKVEDIPF